MSDEMWFDSEVCLAADAENAFDIYNTEWHCVNLNSDSDPNVFNMTVRASSQTPALSNFCDQVSDTVLDVCSGEKPCDINFLVPYTDEEIVHNLSRHCSKTAPSLQPLIDSRALAAVA